MKLRWGVVAFAFAGCDETPPGQTATNAEKDKDPNEVSAVDVPGHRDDRDRDRVMGRDREHRRMGEMPAVDPYANDAEPAGELVATLYGLGDHKDIRGVVHLKKASDAGRPMSDEKPRAGDHDGWGEGDHAGVMIDAMVEGLPAGSHGAHVHLYGDCSSMDGESAGPHLNFHGPSMAMGTTPPAGGTETTARPGVAQAPGASGVQPPAGAVDKTPATMIHGNLGDLVATAGKPATLDAMVPDAMWSSALLGRAIVVHEKPNDPNAGADGGAGARIACGVIGIGNPQTEMNANDATSEAEPTAVTPGAAPGATPTTTPPAPR
jgi:Cu/Zn superoxide dismutase